MKLDSGKSFFFDSFKAKSLSLSYITLLLLDTARMFKIPSHVT